jgi:hypothetical protein
MASIVNAPSFVHRGRAVLRPQRKDRLEAFEVSAALCALGHFGARVDRSATDGAAQDVARLVFADRLAHFVIDRRDDRRLDFAAREDAEFAVGALIRGVVHKRSVRRARG